MSQNISSTFSRDRPHHLHAGHPGQFPSHHLGLGQRLPGPPLLADGEVVKPFALTRVPQRTATLGDGHTRPPFRPLEGAVGARRGTDPPFLHLDRSHRRNAVVVPGEPVGALLAVEVDPLYTVAAAAARGDPTVAVATSWRAPVYIRAQGFPVVRPL